MSSLTNIIITGVGGQGNVLAAQLLASVALEEGYEVAVGDVYGVSQRGGSVASHVRWAKEESLAPLIGEKTLDVLLAFEPLEALRMLSKYGNENTVAIVNDTPISPVGVQLGNFEYPEMSALWNGLRNLTGQLKIVSGTKLANELGAKEALNMIMLGALAGSGFIQLSARTFERVIPSVVSKKHVQTSLLAFKEGSLLSQLG